MDFFLRTNGVDLWTDFLQIEIAQETRERAWQYVLRVENDRRVDRNPSQVLLSPSFLMKEGNSCESRTSRSRLITLVSNWAAEWKQIGTVTKKLRFKQMDGDGEDTHGDEYVAEIGQSLLGYTTRTGTGFMGWGHEFVQAFTSDSWIRVASRSSSDRFLIWGCRNPWLRSGKRNKLFRLHQIRSGVMENYSRGCLRSTWVSLARSCFSWIE